MTIHFGKIVVGTGVLEEMLENLYRRSNLNLI